MLRNAWKTEYDKDIENKTYVVAPIDATVVTTAHAATSTRARAFNRGTRHALEVGHAGKRTSQRAGGKAPAVNVAGVGVVALDDRGGLAGAGGHVWGQARPLVGGVVVGHVVVDLLNRAGELVVGDVRGELESPGDLLDGVGLVGSGGVGGVEGAVEGNAL